MFSAVYGGIRRVKQHHLGVVGRVLGKEMGKDFWYRFFLNNPTHQWLPPLLRTARGVIYCRLAPQFLSLENCDLPRARRALVGTRSRPIG